MTVSGQTGSQGEADDGSAAASTRGRTFRGSQTIETVGSARVLERSNDGSTPSRIWRTSR